MSSHGSEFNYDYRVSFKKDEQAEGHHYNYDTGKFSGEEAPGLSVFSTDGTGKVFHTYSCYARGLDLPAQGVEFP